MLFWNKICGLTSTFFLYALFASAQTSYVKFQGNKIPLKVNINTTITFIKTTYTEGPKLFKPFAIIPKDYYTQHFGIMCKKELAMEKITKIPFRFRLGSLQQCNYLEGKR